MKINSNESLTNSFNKSSRSPLNSLLSTSINNNDSLNNNINIKSNNNKNNNLGMKSLSSSYSFSSSSSASSSSSTRLRRSMLLQTAYLGCQYETLRQDENVQNFRKRIDDEQSDTCIKWINLQFSRLLYDSNGVISNEAKDTYSWLMVTDLFRDFSDGLRLIYLLEIIYNTKLKKELGSKTFGCLKLHKIKNHETCLNYLQKEVKLKCLGINPLDLVEGNKKMIISLLCLIKSDFERKYFKQEERSDRKSCFISSSNISGGSKQSTNRSKSQTFVNEKQDRKRKHLSTQYPSVGYLIDELNARTRSSDTSRNVSRMSLNTQITNKSVANSAVLNTNKSNSKLDQLYNSYIHHDQNNIKSFSDLNFSEINEIKAEMLLDLKLDEYVEEDEEKEVQHQQSNENNEKTLFYSEILELKNDFVTEFDQDLTDSGYSNNTAINCDEMTIKRSKSNSLDSIDSKTQIDSSVIDLDEIVNEKLAEQILNSAIKIVNKPEYTVIQGETTDNLKNEPIIQQDQVESLIETIEDSLKLESQVKVDNQIEIKSTNEELVVKVINDSIAEDVKMILENILSQIELESNLSVEAINDLSKLEIVELSYQIDDCRDTEQFDVYDQEDNDESDEEENTDTVIHNSSFVEPEEDHDDYEDDEYKFENIDLEEKIRDLDELLENQLQNELDKITKDEQLLEILNENLINEKDNLKDIEEILSRQHIEDSSLNQASYFIDNLILDYDHIKPTGYSSCLLDVIEHEKITALNLEVNQLGDNSSGDDLIVTNELQNDFDSSDCNQALPLEDLVLDSNVELIQPEQVGKLLNEQVEDEVEFKNDDLIISEESKEISMINCINNTNNDDDGIQLEDEDQLEAEQSPSKRIRSQSNSSSNSSRSTLSSLSSSNKNLNDILIEKYVSEPVDLLLNRNTYAYALVHGSATQIKIIDNQHCSNNNTITNFNNKQTSNESPRNISKKIQKNRVKLNTAPVRTKTNNLNNSNNEIKKHEQQQQQQPISILKQIESIEEKTISTNSDHLNKDKSKNKSFKTLSNNSIDDELDTVIPKSKSKKVHVNHNNSSKKINNRENNHKKLITNNHNSNINSSRSIFLADSTRNYVSKYFLLTGIILVVSVTLSFFLNNESVFNMYDFVDVMSKLLN